MFGGLPEGEPGAAETGWLIVHKQADTNKKQRVNLNMERKTGETIQQHSHPTGMTK